MYISKGAALCVFCSPVDVEEWCLDGKKYKLIDRFLKAMPAEDIREKALLKLPGEFQAKLRRGLQKLRRCSGFNGVECCFATGVGCKMAQVRKVGLLQCLFCDTELLASKCGSNDGVKQVAAKLKKMDEGPRKKALQERVPEAVAADTETQWKAQFISI